MLGRIKNPKLKVGVDTIAVDLDSFCKQGFNLLQGQRVWPQFLPFPNSHRVQIICERTIGLLLQKPCQFLLNARQWCGCFPLYLAHENVGLVVGGIQVGSIAESKSRLVVESGCKERGAERS